MNKEVTGRLEFWVLDLVHNVLWGNIYDDIHNRWGDGRHIHTSDLKSDNPKSFKEGDIIETRNSSYLLGKART